MKTESHLALRKLDEPKLGDVFVDFVAGAMAHRRKFGGGRGEAVAKAVGIKGTELPSVIDATAGLGRDAFVLASIGLPSYVWWNVIRWYICYYRMASTAPIGMQK